MILDFPAREFEHLGLQPYSHKDMVEYVEFNFYGNRYASGGADGRIKVYNRHSSDGAWHICDTWAAHKSEVLEVSRIINLVDGLI
jgi:nucleoporin SEH1